jgi:hypothetical protein
VDINTISYPQIGVVTRLIITGWIFFAKKIAILPGPYFRLGPQDTKSLKKIPKFLWLI